MPPQSRGTKHMAPAALVVFNLLHKPKCQTFAIVIINIYLQVWTLSHVNIVAQSLSNYSKRIHAVKSDRLEELTMSICLNNMVL